jgi:sugar lactone lactonase YvrE
MDEPRTLLDGRGVSESPRWHGDRLWFSDWGAGEVVAVDLEGRSEVMARARAAPFCIDFLPDGRLLVVASEVGALLRREADGTLVPHTPLPPARWNDIVVDGRGNIYVNQVGFDLLAGEPAALGTVAMVAPDGSVREVADELAFPNGMAVTADGGTLLVAESYAGRLTAFTIAHDGSLSERRVWAEVDGGAPDGICVDADGCAWYADVPNRSCVRVAEGGEVRQRIQLDRGCFACMLGGPGGRTLFMVAAEWLGPANMFEGPPTGQVLTATAPAPHAGWP